MTNSDSYVEKTQCVKCSGILFPRCSWKVGSWAEIEPKCKNWGLWESLASGLVKMRPQ